MRIDYVLDIHLLVIVDFGGQQ